MKDLSQENCKHRNKKTVKGALNPNFLNFTTSSLTSIPKSSLESGIIVQF